MRLPFPSETRIALVVRGKRSRTHVPSAGGHADCILPSGAPVGFLVASAVEAGWGAGSSGSSGAGGSSGSSGSSGPIRSASTLAGVDGGVYTYPIFRARRGPYVTQSDAITYNVCSAVLVITVTGRQARKFQAAWVSMRSNPGDFAIIGNNCATHAALAFAAADLVDREIPDLDTPDNLFHALRSRHGTNCSDHYGFLGFTPTESRSDPMDLPCEVDLMQLLSSDEVAALRGSSARRRP